MIEKVTDLVRWGGDLDSAFVPAHLVPIFNLKDPFNRNQKYIGAMGRVLMSRDVFAIAVYGLSKGESLIVEAMNDGMHWTATTLHGMVDLFCTNQVPEKAVPLLFKTASIDPVRYHIKDAKRRG